MNFLATIGTAQAPQQLVISASSWSSCLAYCEGTGEPIQNILQLQTFIINHNVSGTNCYLVSAVKTLGSVENHYVWEDSFDSLNNWIELQGFLSVQQVQYSNKAYVVV